MPKRNLVFLSIFIILCLPNALLAQDEFTLTANTLVEGSITTPGEEMIWTFFAIRDDVRTLRVDSASDGFDPVLTLRFEGREIITNDDYAPPELRNALLEAITIPRTGVYEVVVTGFADSIGDFTLIMLPGYANAVLDERFATLGSWTSEGIPLLSISDGVLTATQQGIRQRGYVFDGANRTYGDYFARANVQSVTGNNGWIIGLLFRHQANGDGYLVKINAEGWWRFVVVENGEERVIRDWNPHPAIAANTPLFTLGVLANGSGFEVFYDNTLLGRIKDSTFPEAGQIGIVVETPDALESEVTAVLDDLLITVPADVAGDPILPQQIITEDSTIIARELERRHLIPGGGMMVWNVEESFTEKGTPGIGRLPLVSGVTYRNFALGTTMTFAAPLDGTSVAGCGLYVRGVGESDYMAVYLDSTGGYGVSQRVGDTFLPGLYYQNDDRGFQPTNSLVVTLNETELHLIVNGDYAGSLEINPVEGEVGNMVVNFDPLSTSCQFNNTWMWSWDE